MHLNVYFLFCMTWLQYSYLQYLGFKAYLLSSACSNIATQFCLVQVIILVFVVNLIIFDIFVWLQQFGRPKQQFIVSFGQYRFWEFQNVVVKSTNLFISCLLLLNYIICSRLVLYVQGSTFMGILYIGLQYIFAKILSNFCTTFISVFNRLQFHNFVGFFVCLLKNPLWA